MLKRILTTLLLGASLLGTSPTAAKTILRDEGGIIVYYYVQAFNYMASGEPLRLYGLCASACTIYLGVPQFCVSGPFARLGFHQSNYPDGTDMLLAAYPPALQAWIADHGGLPTHESGKLLILSGRELRRFVPPCQ
jgi:hypothetical protein